MTYTRNVPLANDLISDSQAILEANTNIVDSGTTGTGTGFSRNHVTMTDGSGNGGLHNEIDFYQNLSDPTISGFVSAIYPKLVSSQSELFQKNGSGTTQITSGALPIWKGGSTATGVVTATVAATGIVTFPNGLQFQWGQITAASQTNTPVLFTALGGVSFNNNCFNIQTTINENASNANVLDVFSVTKNGFSYYNTSSSSRVYYWFAIGN